MLGSVSGVLIPTATVRTACLVRRGGGRCRRDPTSAAGACFWPGVGHAPNYRPAASLHALKATAHAMVSGPFFAFTLIVQVSPVGLAMTTWTSPVFFFIANANGPARAMRVMVVRLPVASMVWTTAPTAGVRQVEQPWDTCNSPSGDSRIPLPKGGLGALDGVVISGVSPVCRSLVAPVTIP